jgi:hypothetical protein
MLTPNYRSPASMKVDTAIGTNHGSSGGRSVPLWATSGAMSADLGGTDLLAVDTNPQTASTSLINQGGLVQQATRGKFREDNIQFLYKHS